MIVRCKISVLNVIQRYRRLWVALKMFAYHQLVLPWNTGWALRIRTETVGMLCSPVRAFSVFCRTRKTSDTATFSARYGADRSVIIVQQFTAITRGVDAQVFNCCRNMNVWNIYFPCMLRKANIRVVKRDDLCTAAKLQWMLDRCLVHLFGSDWDGTICFWSHQTNKKKKGVSSRCLGLIEKLAALFDPRKAAEQSGVPLAPCFIPQNPCSRFFTVNIIPSGIGALGQRAGMKSK